MPRERALRILLVLRAPWDARLGSSQVLHELAREFRHRGHVVDKYSYEEAFPNGSRLAHLAGSFARRAGRHIAGVSSRYDVIDAQQGTIPFTRESLRFRGVVVARSLGLDDFYRRFEKQARRRWPEEFRGGNPVGSALRRRKARLEERDSDRMLQSCDLINAVNHDEVAFLVDERGLGDKTVLIPHGISVETFEALAPGAGVPAKRLAKQQIGFVGYWDIRKGSRDWREILEGVRRELPGASFRFAGTTKAQDEVLRYLGPESGRGVAVVPEFPRNELPSMLDEVTVGALPSYIEGFPLVVLEKLAAGIPSVAYDVPGPRDSLGQVDPSLLVPVGDTGAFARCLVAVLTMSRLEYLELAARCRAVAERYLWPGLAARTLTAYQKTLENIKAASPPT